MSSQHNYQNRRYFIKGSCYSLASLLLATSKATEVLSIPPVNFKKTFIPALNGNVEVGKLGTTLMHEHILVGNIPQHLQQETINIAVNMVNEAYKAGVTTIVDVMPFDFYCNGDSNDHPGEYEYKLALYKAIAAKTRVNIIVSTGFYRYEKAPQVIKEMSEEKMEERIYRAVTEGVGNSNIKAGIIKVAADRSTLTDWEKKAFRAAARVQKRTGVPIATHAVQGACEQFDILVENGADPNHINLAHIETEDGWEGRSMTQTAEHLLRIVKGGGYLLFNNFSCEFYTPWKDLVYLIRYFCDKGYSNRIMISEDTNWEWMNNKVVFEAEQQHPEAAKRTYAWMMTHEVPLMKQAGFTDQELKTFLIDNPRNYFSK